MATQTEEIHLETKGFADVVDLTAHVEERVRRGSLKSGTVTVFVPGSTAGLTTIEYESGAVHDLVESIKRIAPEEIEYKHDLRWGDGNGFSHVRAALLGPSLTIPFVDRQLLLGTWQQIVLIDFDNRRRRRKVILQLVGDEGP